MKTLGKNWITERLIDFEYKKYMLLAYLKEVSEQFGEQKLYPALADLVFHYRNLLAIKENKKNMFDSFPERMIRADFEQFKAVYEKIVEDDSLMQEIEQIIDFSIPQIEYHLADGKKIYDFIEERVRIAPVGIIPLNASEGYLFLRNGNEKDTRVYEYQITIFDNPVERYRGIHVNYLTSYKNSLTFTVESIKTDLIKYHKKLPNPATYFIETPMQLPYDETLLPMAKRILVKYVATNEPAS